MWQLTLVTLGTRTNKLTSNSVNIINSAFILWVRLTWLWDDGWAVPNANLKHLCLVYCHIDAFFKFYMRFICCLCVSHPSLEAFVITLVIHPSTARLLRCPNSAYSCSTFPNASFSPSQTATDPVWMLYRVMCCRDVSFNCILKINKKKIQLKIY